MSSSPESETTSIFSPPVTRATSATTRYSDALSDKVISSHFPRNGLAGPRSMGRVQTTSTLLQSRTNTQSTRQRPHTLDPPQLQRNKSTKELINKFESLTKPQTSTTSDTTRNRLDESQSTMFKSKARNPLRRSFGNLLVAFTKKLKPQVREKLSPSPSVTKELPSSQPPNAKIAPSCTHPSYRDLASLADDPIISGPALYLSTHTSTENMLPVWTECDIALYPTHILVTWQTTHGNPISRMIKLESCVDVKSIPLDKLGELEVALLPDFDRKAFFLSFEGAPQEKFLVPSISERAKWVSSVWSVILGDQRDQLQQAPDQHIPTRRPSPPPVSRASNFSADSASKITVLSASDYYADRDLPPTPSIYSPDHAFSTNSFLQRGSSLSRSRPESPRSVSILNLDRKAMVTRRISQLEPHRTDTQLSRPRGRSGSGLWRRGSARSTGSDSLLELYTVESAVSEAEPYTRPALPAPSLALIPEVASMSQISETHPLSLPASLNNPTSSVDTDGRLAPLVELLQDQATKHYYHTNDLKDQIASLNSEMHTMFQELKVVTGEQPAPEVNMSKFQEALDKSFTALETTIGNLQGKGEGMIDLRQKLDAIQDQIKSLGVAGGSSTPLNTDPSPIGETVLEKLETLRMEIKDQEGLPEDILVEITKLREALDRLPPGDIAGLRNIGKSQESNTEGPASAPTVDLSEVHAKLDELMEDFKSQLAREPVTPKVEIPELQDIMKILVETRDQQATQNDRQADSARYLNELNSWLDKFVKDGTSKIDTVAAAVTQFSRGVSPGVDQFGNPTGTLFDGLQTLLAESRARDLTIHALQASVNTLFAAINERLPSGGTNGTLTTEAVENLFDKQRQEQEQVLRAVAADLSDDIKGERLRFIEAMKEATAINIQNHVEEFKRQLTREVMVMTGEVGRLQKERQALEQQIADLFTFYAKQKSLTAGLLTMSGQQGPPGPPQAGDPRMEAYSTS
ncbi:hypothetical protein BDM02DRAFT_1731692 [Thelephora ganbajun]|uniref:Uncharacterized protein n=1 Tax=Thelephora ganbajun TaxID=370292 RepID=A0ACB6ZKJ6_THEGA|nr:hypothetical protein BDM02DRAFT_1731692 [Thelephora ganbajun]